MRFQGKVAIVTGGSRGIGYATAAGFLNEGATVVLCASRQETAEQAAKQLRQATPTAQVEGIWPDLSSFSAVSYTHLKRLSHHHVSQTAYCL